MTPPPDLQPSADAGYGNGGYGGGYGNGGYMHPLVKLIIQVGVPSAIAMYLVYLLGGGVSQEVRTLSQALVQHQSESAGQSKQLDRLQRSMNIQNALSLQQCVNAARNETARDGCYTAFRGQQ